MATCGNAWIERKTFLDVEIEGTQRVGTEKDEHRANLFPRYKNVRRLQIAASRPTSKQESKV